MKYAVRDIAVIIHATAVKDSSRQIDYLLIDSRKIVFPATSLFFALPGPRRDGHDFIAEVYERGVRAFVISSQVDVTRFPDAVFLSVKDVLQALQQLAAYHRRQFSIPVIGITGSNGKTIVKEWLYQLLSPDYNIVRSPRSYNSQIGVPLSVWQMNEHHTLAIFEAGISTTGEMTHLQQIIQPTMGVLTNIGKAHDEGFINTTSKFTEKLQLFEHCDVLIGRGKDFSAQQAAVDDSSEGWNTITWGYSHENDYVVADPVKHNNGTDITLSKGTTCNFHIPFTDDASIENAITCCCVMLQLGYAASVISERLGKLQPVEMRLQQKKGVNNCYVVNDSYSNDPYSFSIALDYLKQQAGTAPTTVILSDFMQANGDKHQLYETVAHELQQRNIHRLIGIGNDIVQHEASLRQHFTGQLTCFSDAASFFERVNTHQFRDEYILLKGARVFEFEKIGHWLEQKVHQTLLEVNLTAMIHNLKVYQQMLQPTTKMMVMVKAFSYGSGTAEVARVLQYHKVDYLAVAYADEGVELRKAGISLPIMVMNPDEMSFDAIVDYNLEPELYAFHILDSFSNYLTSQGLRQFPVHIKIDTGMHRLGFEADEVEALCKELQQSQQLAVRSVFSHLVGSEDPSLDEFTRQQSKQFYTAATAVENALGYTVLKHIANTSGINRHPHLQYDMVRLGIGLYGVDSSAGIQQQLQTVATLTATIAQIKKVQAGESVGYSRKGVVTSESLIATVRIGYADGLNRHLGNGKGYLWVNGQPAPIIGNVCMDMTMIDVTRIPGVSVGDSVEIFGRNIPVQQVAAWNNTIAYEVLTGVSQRVKRVYIEE